jgi:hypothetical protein
VEELAGREAELRPADLPKVNLKGIEELVTERATTAARWSRESSIGLEPDILRQIG